MLLIITSTVDRLFRFVNIDDLERPRQSLTWVHPARRLKSDWGKI